MVEKALVKKTQCEIESIIFGNPTFKSSINNTVRLGTKWHNKKGVYRIEGSDNTINILMTYTIRLKSLKDSTILELNHDPKCRSYEGIVKELEACYGCGFTEESYVTVVYFRLNQPNLSPGD